MSFFSADHVVGALFGLFVVAALMLLLRGAAAFGWRRPNAQPDEPEARKDLATARGQANSVRSPGVGARGSGR